MIRDRYYNPPAMRVAVHAGTLRGAGSGFVGRELLQALRRTAEDVIAWVPAEWQVAMAPGVHPTRNGLRTKFLAENWEIPRTLKRTGCDALLSLGDTSSVRPGCPHVLFVQQAYLAYPPTEWGFVPSTRFRAKLALMELYFRAGMPSVSRFVVQTQDMKQQLVRRWGLEATRVSVIPTSVSRNMLEPPTTRASTDAARYVMCVGTASPHKNYAVLPAVIRHLRDRTAKVRVTLRRGEVPALDDGVQRANLQDRVEYLGHLEETQLIQHLAGATAVILPSVLESFGLTYYEAMALGVPIVAADRGFAREACGDAAAYAPADNARALAESLDVALAYTKQERQLAAEMLRARFEVVYQDWDTIAASYVETIKGVL